MRERAMLSERRARREAIASYSESAYAESGEG